jgi:hypothetical protein
MAYDAFIMSSIRPLDYLVHIFAVDGTPLPVTSQALLALHIFIFLMMIMFLDLPCNSFVAVRLMATIVGPS